MKDSSQHKNLIFEAEVILNIYTELIYIFKKEYKNYFNLIKLTLKMENEMLEKNFMRFIINDILLTEDYTLEGIALYTDTPKDVVIEFASGLATNPSAHFFLKIIALHRSVRPQLYKEITSNFNPDDQDET